MNRIRTYFALCRIGIALFTTCSAVTCYLAAGGPVASRLGWLVLGILLPAGGASALNQYQERDIDARMERTRQRPLPAGTLSGAHALVAAAVLILSGLLALRQLGTTAPALGAFAVLWYNGLYTALKRRTVFAAIYGAVVGAIPPAIGWTAAGNSMADPRFLVLGALFLLWQVPHFWLLLIRREAEYRNAGLPVLTDLFGTARLARLTLLWTLAAATVPLLMPLFGLVRSRFMTWSLPVVMALTIAAVLSSSRREAAPASFRWINGFLAVLMTLLSLDSLLRRMG